MNERISALMDGEAHDAELDQDMARLRSDAALRGKWDAYHLIGDVLRGDVAPGLAERVAARLAAEPTVLAPPRRKPVSRAMQIAFSAAAGLAGVALVAWLALPQLEPQQVATSTQPAAATSSVAVAVPAQTASPVTPAAVGVENYLLAHQRFSHAIATQGVAPYARAVADEREGGAE
jgi:sigma-E factor negative regulatory protein RseA